MIGELFYTFLKIGMFSIGGGYAIIPLIQAQVVDGKGWVTEAVFTDIITISQMTPGPLAVNTSTFVGMQIGGVRGAAAATVGCILAGMLISIFLYEFFRRYKKSVYIFEVLRGLKAASLGLIMSAGFTILLLTFFGNSEWKDIIQGSGPDGWAVLLFAAALLILRKVKMSPVRLMLLSGAAGLLIYL